MTSVYTIPDVKNRMSFVGGECFFYKNINLSKTKIMHSYKFSF